MDNELAALADGARRGNDAALDRLLVVAEPMTRRWASRLVDPAAVDDVVQESLTEVYSSIAALREPAAIVGWLRLVVRKHADRHRRKQRPTMVLDLVIDALPAEDDPASLTERRTDAALVRRALAAAPDTDRLILALRYFGDWTDAELSELMDISPGAVRKRLFDARRRLRPHLASHFEASHSEASHFERPQEEAMKPDLTGQHLNTDQLPTLPPVNKRPQRPQHPARLETGVKVLDAVVPWPRGGVVDLLGPVGTGHLVLLNEVAHNISAKVVAVSTEGSRSRLWKLLNPDGMQDLATVIPSESFEFARDLSALLAADGETVLLVVDNDTALDTAVGVLSNGSVTGVRVAPHARDAEPTAPLAGADTTTVMGTAEFVAGLTPPVDILASSSTVVLNDADRQAAEKARQVLASAAAVRDYLNQPLWMLEDISGVPGIKVSAASAGLTAVVNTFEG